MKMPKVLWVRLEDEVGPLAYDSLADAIEDNGPTTLGVYKLMDTIKRKKIVAPV